MFALYSSEIVGLQLLYVRTRIEADVLCNVGNERANQFGSLVCLGKQLGVFLVGWFVHFSIEQLTVGKIAFLFPPLEPSTSSDSITPSMLLHPTFLCRENTKAHHTRWAEDPSATHQP